jgi:SNF2 family DNA or RNA helicase
MIELGPVSIAVYEVATEEEFARIDSLSLKERESFLFLEPHPTHERHWAIESYSPRWFKDFKGVLKRRVVNPFTYDKFLERCKEKGYEIRFLEDPTKHFEWAASLYDEPPVIVNSDLEGTINGMWPFQIQGFNFLKDLRGGVANWSTGTGKTVVAVALTKYHRDNDHYDLALYVCKRKSKTNVQRSLKALVDLHGEIIKTAPAARLKQYEALAELADKGEKPLLILNYEKFRDDETAMKNLLTGRRVWIIWDEMPAKLKHRGSQLYRNTAKVLYTSATDSSSNVKWKSLRAADMRSLVLSATLIEHSPMDFYNCVRLVDPERLGTIDQFHSKYVRSWSPYADHKPAGWKNLALLGEIASQFTHQVDKDDPDIAKYFPEILEQDIYLDLDPDHQALYDALMDEYAAEQDFETANILAKITVAQQLLDHPRLVLESSWKEEGAELAKKFVNKFGPEKLAKIKPVKIDELIERFESHQNEKGLVFSIYASMLKYMIPAAQNVGLNYVVFRGGMSDRDMQEVIDRFTNDPDCKLFLSTDAGGDSLDFPEATYTINFDLGYSWAAKKQRENRKHRIVSTKKTQYIYNFYVPNSVEERKREVIQRKYQYHQEIFKGTVSDLSEGARLSKGDLFYILLGRSTN